MTHTENTDALRQLLRALRGAGELVTVFEDAQAAQTLLTELHGRLGTLKAEEIELVGKLARLRVEYEAKVAADTTARAEADDALQQSLKDAQEAAAVKIDKLTADVSAIEASAMGRVNEANAKVAVAEAALAETTAQYEAVQAKVNEIKAKLG